MNLQDFDNRLKPYRLKLWKFNCKDALVSFINYLFAVVLGVCLALLVLRAVSLQIGLSPLLVIAMAFILPALYRLVRELFRLPAFDKTAAAIDKYTNHHNIIATAYEYTRLKKNSEFAIYAIEYGLGLLEFNKPGTIATATHKPNFKRMFVAIIMVLLCATIKNEKIAYGVEYFSQEGENQVAGSFADKRPYQEKNNIASMSDALSNKAGKIDVISKSLEGDYAGSDGISGGQYSSQQSSSQSRKNSNDFSEKDDEQSILNNAELAGNSDSPLSLTNIKSNYVNIGNSAEDEHSNSDVNEQDKNAKKADSLRQPFLDDRRAAPGRELGRSGNSSKPGDGRGGPGMMKKSRTTASVVSSRTIPVFINSKPDKGKSKSFQANTSLNTGEKPFVNEYLSRPETEGFVVKEKIRQLDAALIKAYFEELNYNDNRRTESETSD